MHKGFIKTGAIMAALAVALGAFGAHGLKKHIADPQRLQNWGMLKWKPHISMTES